MSKAAVSGFDRDPAEVDVGEELRSLIAANIDSHSRSQQTEIGASEIGSPCPRKVALKLLATPGVPEQIDPEDKWRATVGTAVHEWLASMLRRDNERLAAEFVPGRRTPCHPWCEPGIHYDRWLVELGLPVGTVEGQEIPGHLDVYDRWTKTVVDWKIVGPTALKERKHDRYPGDEYRVQSQLYGRGLVRIEGEDVQYVGIMFLPSNGELKTYFYWEEEFDPEVGKQALAHARMLKRELNEHGRSIIPKLKTYEDHCAHCPFFAPGTHDEEYECPGDPSLTADMADSFADLLPHGEAGARLGRSTTT